MSDSRRWGINNIIMYARNRQLKRAATLVASLCLLYISYELLATGSASTYESSIYGIYPTTIWIAFTLGIVSGIFLLWLSYSGVVNGLVGLAIVLVYYLLFFFIPLYRGYLMYGRDNMDVLVHSGFIRGISESGVMSDWNVYPGVHLLAGVNKIVTEISLIETTLVFRYLLFMMIPIGVSLFAYSYFSKHHARGVLIAGTPLIFTAKTMGFGTAFLSLFIVPLTYFAFTKIVNNNKGTRFIFVLLIFMFSLALYHPLTFSILTGSLSIFWFFHRSNIKRIQAALLFVTFSIFFIYWILQFDVRIQALIGSISFLEEQGSVPQGEQSSSPLIVSVLATAAGYGEMYIVRRFAGLYGVIFCYGAIWMGMLYHYTVAGIREQKVCVVISQAVYGGFVAVFFLFTSFIVSGPIRASKFLAVVLIMTTGIYLSYNIIESGRQRRIIAVLILSVIILLTPIALMNAYEPDRHFTETEYNGVEWTLKHQNEEVKIFHVGQSPKVSTFINGEKPSINELRTDEKFKISSNQMFSRIVHDSTVEKYILTGDHVSNSDRYNNPYGENYMHKMNSEPSLNNIYESDGFNLWKS